MSRLAPILLLSLALTTSASLVFAQNDVAGAEALFREARELMKNGEFEKACPKLEESQRLDPGVGTLANLARCYEETNRLASAWAKYLEASAEARRRGEGKRAKQASRKAEQLEPRLHRLTILVPRKSRIDGLVVTRNRIRVGAGAYGSEVPVDEGVVTIEARADGHKPWKKSITVKGGRKTRVVEIPPLEKAPEVIVEDGDGGNGGNGNTLEIVPGEPWFKDTIGWGLVAGGVVLAGGGFASLLRSNQLLDDSREPGIGVEEFDRRVDSADRFKLIGNGLLVAGAAVAVIGAVKLAIAPRDTTRERTSTTLLIGPTSLGVSGRF